MASRISASSSSSVRSIATASAFVLRSATRLATCERVDASGASSSTCSTRRADSRAVAHRAGSSPDVSASASAHRDLNAALGRSRRNADGDTMPPASQPLPVWPRARQCLSPSPRPIGVASVPRRPWPRPRRVPAPPASVVPGHHAGSRIPEQPFPSRVAWPISRQWGQTAPGDANELGVGATSIEAVPRAGQIGARGEFMNVSYGPTDVRWLPGQNLAEDFAKPNTSTCLSSQPVSPRSFRRHVCRSARNRAEARNIIVVRAGTAIVRQAPQRRAARPHGRCATPWPGPSPSTVPRQSCRP